KNHHCERSEPKATEGQPIQIADAGLLRRYATRNDGPVDTAANTPSVVRDGAWRAELRATLALAWPLILANLTQQIIQATDVLLMGRLGATQLAAATL